MNQSPYLTQGKNWHLNKANKTSCAKFPTLWDLHINNLYWQETETSNGTFYLYGAYLDRRKNNRDGRSLILYHDSILSKIFSDCNRV